jgi:hypothetical protein
MSVHFRLVRFFIGMALVVGVAGWTTGCGALSVGLPVPVFPDTLQNFNLQQLKEIQQDTTLTADEKRQKIRDATGAPNTPEGDRLVNFLLNFTQP